MATDIERHPRLIMKLTPTQLSQLIKEELSKAAPFGSGMKQAKLDKDQKDLVGHT